MKLTLNNGNAFAKRIEIYPGTASYVIKNTTSFAFYNVVSLFGTSTEIIDYFMHTSGPFTTGQVTNTIYTFRPIIQAGFEDANNRFITEPYIIVKGEHNILEISAKTRAYISPKSTKKPELANAGTYLKLSEKLKLN